MIQALKGVAAAVAALLAVAGGALVLAYGVVGVALDWAPLKGPIESRLSAALGGRGVEIRGALDVDLFSRHPRVSLWNVAVANADWGSEPYMFEAQRLTVALDLPALLSGGPLALPQVGLLRPDLLLERSADGRSNWDFGGPEDEGPPDIPEIRSIALHEGAITYRDPLLDEDLVATALEAGGALPAGSPVSLNASGRLQGEPLDLRLAGGSLAELEGRTEPYPLDLSLRVGESSARVAGTVVQPLDLQGLDVEVAAESPDASVVRSVFGLPAGVDSYHLNGRVGWDGESWAVSGLDAHLGDSDLRGSAGYTAGGERPALRAELASDRLNLDQLRAFAAPADAGDGEDGPATGDDGAAGGGFDPERLLASLDDLRTVDAEIAYTAGAIEAEGLPVRSAALGVRLQDGVLDVQRLRVDLTDGGRLAGTVHIDAGRDPVPVEAALEVGETSLRVAGTLDRPPDAGPFGLDVSLRSPDPSVVTSLLGWPPDALPALAFEGRIGREGDAWVFDDFSAEAGPSDLRGSLRIDEGGERPSITGELASNRFDLDQVRRVADRVQALARGEEPDEAAEATAAEEPAGETEGDDGGFWAAVSAAAETLRAADADLRLAVDTFEAEAVPVVRGFAGHLRVDGGQLVAEEVRLDLPEGPITGTIRADASGGAGDAIPVSIVASAGESTVRAEGTLTEETSLDAFTLELDGEGRNLATLNVAVHPFADWSLPETPPYRVEGTLVHEGGDWALDDFRIAMGRSDLVGTLRYRGADGEGRPLVTGSLTSTTLDLPEVLVVAGLRSPVEEEVEEEEVAGEIVEEAAQMDEAEDAAEAEEEGGGEPVLPDPSLQLAFLREFDAEIDYRSGEVRAPQFPVQNLALSLRLEGGVLTVDPLEMEGGGGRLTAPFVLNAGADPTEIELDARLRGFDTRHIMVLFGEQAQEVAEGGRVSGRVAAKARGNTLREALGAATGDVAVIMEGGWISSLVIEVFGFDLGEALAVWFTAEDEEDEGEVADGGEAEGGEGDEETDKVAVRCLVGDFNLQGGVLAAETLVLDTTDTNIVGRGTIDLGSETLDLTLEPNAKDASVLTAQTPIHIQGTFGDVEINPDRESLMARGAAAVGLGVLIPVIGAVIPFIEPGLGEDSDCRGLIADAETRVDEGAGQGGAAQ